MTILLVSTVRQLREGRCGRSLHTRTAGARRLLCRGSVGSELREATRRPGGRPGRRPRATDATMTEVPDPKDTPVTEAVA
jgi:hypothetical protein